MLDSFQVERIVRSGMGYKDIPKIDYGNEITESFELNHKKNKLVVKEILEGFDKATNNDFILCVEFWNLMNQIKITNSNDGKEVIIHIEKDRISNITSPESITRCRRVLNNSGIGLPTRELVRERRFTRAKALKKYFGRKR